MEFRYHLYNMSANAASNSFFFYGTDRYLTLGSDPGLGLAGAIGIARGFGLRQFGFIISASGAARLRCKLDLSPRPVVGEHQGNLPNSKTNRMQKGKCVRGSKRPRKTR
jgi:hypothetical protein